MINGGDDKIQEKVHVKRLIACNKQQQLSAMHKKLSYELKLLMTQQIKPQDVTASTISYNMQTEDNYLKNDWFVNQSFGFHGAMNESDSIFLNNFYGEENKKFLPIAGAATKLNTSNILVAHAYSFLPLPIHTGLPIHVNGHFAIHSSRRSIWEHTSFGQWNKILRSYVMAPSYCHFLVDLGKTFRSPADVKQWVRFMPECKSARDEFFVSLVRELYTYIVTHNIPAIPIAQNGMLEFHSPDLCIFATAIRNEVVESVLLGLKQSICTLPEVGMRFKMAAIDNLSFLVADVALQCLKSVDLGLPKVLSATPVSTHDTLKSVLKFVLEGSAGKDYSLLVNSPLCLTADNLLRSFSCDKPVFVDSEYSVLLPLSTDMFIHKDISGRFLLADTCKGRHPIRRLLLADLGELLPRTTGYMDKAWTKALWRLIKVRHVLGRLIKARHVLYPELFVLGAWRALCRCPCCHWKSDTSSCPSHCDMLFCFTTNLAESILYRLS